MWTWRFILVVSHWNSDMPATSVKRPSKDTGPNLTLINYYGRLLVKYGLAFLVFLMVGRVLWTAAVNYWVAMNPPPPPPPTVGFGVLPRLEFPPQSDEEKPEVYTLEMAYGLRDSTDRAKVFLMPKASINLLADDQVKQLAAKYGFIFAPELIADKLYRFTKVSPVDTSLEISAIDFTFSLRSNFLSRPDLLASSGKLPEEFEAVERVKRFVDISSLMGADIATAAGEVTFLKSIGGTLRQAYALADADFLQVDLSRSKVDGLYAFYTPVWPRGIISAKLTAAFAGNNSIVEMDYHYRGVDYLNFETYPLRGVRAAWQSVQAGEAFMLNPKQVQEAVIREVELAYYDHVESQAYMQPIYVFKGDQDFMAFVPAVSANYLSRN